MKGTAAGSSLFGNGSKMRSRLVPLYQIPQHLTQRQKWSHLLKPLKLQRKIRIEQNLPLQRTLFHQKMKRHKSSRAVPRYQDEGAPLTTSSDSVAQFSKSI